MIDFSLMYLHLEVGIKMYDLNQSNFLFTLQKDKYAKITKYIFIKMHIQSQECKDKIILVKIMHFYTYLQVQTH